MNREEAIKTLGAVFAFRRLSTRLVPAGVDTGSPNVFDVRTFGAKGDAAADDRRAIQDAIDAANSSGGGVVLFPRGKYRVDSTVVVPPLTDRTIVLRGEGMRSTYVYPGVNGMTALRFGAGVADPSGTNANTTQYCGMEDMSVSGSLLSGGTNVGVQFVQMKKGWLRNIIIESLMSDGSIGLHLKGSVTKGGIGALAVPHTWRCNFSNVVVGTTMRPLVIDNADENDFYNCNFSVPVGLKAPKDSIHAVEFIQGRNNRFYGLCVNGDRSPANRNAYVGLKFDAPINGDNLGHQVYGFVAEGFDYGVYIDNGNVSDILVLGFNSSISAHAFWNGSDDGTTDTERENNVTIEMVSSSMSYRSHRSVWPEPVTFPDGDSAPSVKGSDTFACRNTKPTIIVEFAGGRPGQVIFIRLDGNTTIAANANIRPAANRSLTGGDHLMVGFALIGGTWEQIALSRNG